MDCCATVGDCISFSLLPWWHCTDHKELISVRKRTARRNWNYWGVCRRQTCGQTDEVGWWAGYELQVMYQVPGYYWMCVCMYVTCRNPVRTHKHVVNTWFESSTNIYWHFTLLCARLWRYDVCMLIWTSHRHIPGLTSSPRPLFRKSPSWASCTCTGVLLEGDSIPNVSF